MNDHCVKEVREFTASIRADNDYVLEAERRRQMTPLTVRTTVSEKRRFLKNPFDAEMMDFIFGKKDGNNVGGHFSINSTATSIFSRPLKKKNGIDVSLILSERTAGILMRNTIRHLNDCAHCILEIGLSNDFTTSITHTAGFHFID